MQPILAVYSEQKDEDCLLPLVDELRARGFTVPMLRWTADREDQAATVRRMAAEGGGKRPFLLIATREVGRLAKRFLGDVDPVVVYTEHGIAPFKTYSFHDHFLDYTYTLFPTNLMRYRMNRLYPDHTAQFLIGGYPRLDVLHRLVEERRPHRESLRHSLFPKSRADCLKMVILSWNISVEAYQGLPDDDRVAYLLHPSTPAKVTNSRSWDRATVVRSTPERAADLFVATNLVIGELSSMTMEAVSFSPHVVWLVDKRLYIEKPDITPVFLDETSPHYLKIPMTSTVLDRATVFSLDDLPRLLDARLDDLDAYRPGVAALPDIAFTRPPGENTRFTADKIASVAKRHGIRPPLSGRSQDVIPSDP